MESSSAMTSTDTPIGNSRWDYAKELCTSLSRIGVKINPSGIKVVFFNNVSVDHPALTPDRIDRTFQDHPITGANLVTAALKKSLDEFFSTPEDDRAETGFVVLLASVPADGDQLLELLEEASDKVDSAQSMVIQFMQIGKDPLTKEFIEEVAMKLRSSDTSMDIVHTWNCDDMAKTSVAEIESIFNKGYADIMDQETENSVDQVEDATNTDTGSDSTAGATFSGVAAADEANVADANTDSASKGAGATPETPAADGSAPVNNAETKGDAPSTDDNTKRRARTGR